MNERPLPMTGAMRRICPAFASKSMPQLLLCLSALPIRESKSILSS